MLRTLAQLISLVFHPLLITTYMLVILLLVNPYMFGVPSIFNEEARILILIIFASTFFIPAFAVLMMRMLGLSESMEMEKKEDRIIPYIATSVFYLAMFRFLLSDNSVPVAFKAFVLGVVIALFVAFFINLFSKISIHAVGMGGLLAMTIIMMTSSYSYGNFLFKSEIFGDQLISLNALLMSVIIICGLVASARLFLNAHNIHDLLGGFLVGFGAQFLALRIFEMM